MPDPRYGSAHQNTRAGWDPIVQAGQAWCCERVCVNRGGRWIPPDVPGQPTGWHLAHTDDGLAYKGPAHAGCNTADGGRRSRLGIPKRPARTTPRRSWRPTRAW